MPAFYNDGIQISVLTWRWRLAMVSKEHFCIKYEVDENLIWKWKVLHFLQEWEMKHPNQRTKFCARQLFTHRPNSCCHIQTHILGPFDRYRQMCIRISFPYGTFIKCVMGKKAYIIFAATWRLRNSYYRLQGSLEHYVCAGEGKAAMWPPRSCCCQGQGFSHISNGCHCQPPGNAGGSANISAEM